MQQCCRREWTEPNERHCNIYTTQRPVLYGGRIMAVPSAWNVNIMVFTLLNLNSIIHTRAHVCAYASTRTGPNSEIKFKTSDYSISDATLPMATFLSNYTLPATYEIPVRSLLIYPLSGHKGLKLGFIWGWSWSTGRFPHYTSMYKHRLLTRSIWNFVNIH